MANVAMTSDDRISELPEPILHHILSLVPIKDAARTSILSKRWNSIWITLPYLNFSSYDDMKKKEQQRQKNKGLLEVVDKIILSRCQRQIAGIERFCLTLRENRMSMQEFILCPDLVEYSKLERWIHCVATCSLRVLILIITDPPEPLYTILPSAILSAKSLNVLCLKAFSLELLTSHDIKFPSLRDLKLTDVYLNDEILQKLISGSPLLQCLQLRHCGGFKSVYVTGLVKLELFEMVNEEYVGLEIVEIEAPNLQVLWVYCLPRSCKFNVAPNSSVKVLIIGGSFLTEEVFSHLISRFLALEHVAFVSPAMENIKISSKTPNIVDFFELRSKFII